MKQSNVILVLVIVTSLSGGAIAQYSLRDMMQHAGASFLGLRDDLDDDDVEAANEALQSALQSCGGCHQKYRPQRGAVAEPWRLDPS